MPEGAIHKYHQFVFDKRNVRLAGKFSLIAPVADPGVPDGLFQPLLRFGVVTPDFGHVEGTLAGGIKTVLLAKLRHLDIYFPIRFHGSNLRKIIKA